MLSGMKDDFRQMLAEMASDYIGPAGPIPLERLLRKHHRLLVDLRAGGLTWEQVSRVLAGAGVLHRNGRAFPPSHLRGVFGRHRKRLGASSPKTKVASDTYPADRILHRQAQYESERAAVLPQRSGISNMIAAPNHAGSSGLRTATTGVSPDGSPDQCGGEHSGIASASASPDHSRAQLLARMRQSAQARRVSE